MKEGEKTLYYIKDFLEKDQILIAGSLQEQERYPFTDTNAREFLANFYNDAFTFDGPVKSIIVTDGAAKPPNLHSFADGLLIPYSAKEFKKNGKGADAIGVINFSCCKDTGKHDIEVEVHK